MKRVLVVAAAFAAGVVAWAALRRRWWETVAWLFTRIVY